MFSGALGLIFARNGKNMEVEVKIGNCFRLNRVVGKIIKQQASLPVRDALWFFKLHRQLNEIEEFVLQRLELVLGSGLDVTKEMTEAQTLVYDAIMNTPTCVNIDKAEAAAGIFDNAEITLTIEDVELLCEIFPEESMTCLKAAR